MQNKKIIVVVVLVLFVAVAIGLFLKQKVSNKLFDQSKTDEAKVKITKTHVDFSKTPEKFPENVPIESTAKLTQNYNSTTSEGHFQATRTFETQSTLEENFKLYTDFLKIDGWDIRANTDTPTYKMLLGIKGSQSLQITIDENMGSLIKTVSISYGELK